MGDPYYSLTALPVLGPPGSPPPLSLAGLLAWLPPGAPTLLARTILLGEDLLQRETLRAGGRREVEPAVLTEEEVAGLAPLPEELEPRSGAPDYAIPVDAVWDAYYHSAADVAHRLHSEFLARWIATEVRLRNELARARARALGLQPVPYMVARELESSGAEVAAAVQAWSDATDPLMGLRALIAARWRWIEQVEPLFTFEDDEYAAYAAKLTLLHRWQRTTTDAVMRTAVEGSVR